MPANDNIYWLLAESSIILIFARIMKWTKEGIILA